MSVKRRVVYYLSGFDPRGVRYYHSLYKEHFTKQSALNGLTGSVSSRKKIHNHLYQWEIEAHVQGKAVHTTYRFLSWDDIIRHEWSSGLFNYYKDIFLFIRGYLLNGLFVPFSKHSPKQLIAGLYPLVYLIGALLLAFYAGTTLYQIFHGWIGGLLGVGLGLGVLILLQRFGDRVGVFWLLRIYIFCLHLSKNQIERMEERISHFSADMISALDSEEIDEVLLVSHSVGTILAVSVLSQALNKTLNWDKFGMVTLGECIPLVSFQPDARRYRDELQAIANHKNLFWLDYTAPIDGACFPLHDFMKSSGIKTKSTLFPRYLSPRFHTVFDRITYKRLRRDWYATHFLYIMSSQKVGEYDYFAMTAGAEFIRNKFDRQKS
ncbi:hypothetical protein [Sulfuricurvum sp.]|uniref:hypothetical protein n=1 Tax=Sulfuricurvum sp. TaxID=2025608 RepID=UPI002E37DA0B|nr:hypothetical protein [Sulfuricurvum sp.]HEX5330353.1 hypothetical protein [Sulfuricurvum sp.]